MVYKNFHLSTQIVYEHIIHYRGNEYNDNAMMINEIK